MLQSVIYPLKNCTTPGLYSRLFQKQMVPCDRFQCPEQIPASPNFQNGDRRVNHKRQMAGFNRPKRHVLSCTDTQRIPTSTRLLMFLIGVLAFLEKTRPMGWLHMSPFMVSANKLTISPVTTSEDSCFEPSEKASSVVEKSPKCENRLSSIFRRAQHPYFHRCVKPGLGSPSRKHDSQWHFDRSRKNYMSIVLDLKAVFLTLKTFKTKS